MTKKITLLGLFLMAFYSYKGQSTSSAKSLLSGAVMNYSAEENTNTVNQSNFKLFDEGEPKVNKGNRSLAQSGRNRKRNASWIEDSYRIKRNIAVYKLN